MLVLIDMILCIDITTFLDDSVHDSQILPPRYVAYQGDYDRDDGSVLIGQEKYYHSTL